MKKWKKLGLQVLRFCLVGVLCFGIDFGLLILLTELVGMVYLLSAAVSFIAATAVNYLLSIRFIFESQKGKDRRREMALFLLLSLVGLVCNELVMAVVVEIVRIPYQIGKLAATVIVGVYNFVTRKRLLEGKGEKPHEENSEFYRQS